MKQFRLALLLMFVGTFAFACGDDSSTEDAKDSGADASDHDHDGSDMQGHDAAISGSDAGDNPVVDSGSQSGDDSGATDDDAGDGPGGTKATGAATGSATFHSIEFTATTSGLVFDESKSDSREVALYVTNASPICPVLLEQSDPGNAMVLAFDIKSLGKKSKWAPVSFTLDMGGMTEDGAKVGADKVTLNKYGTDMFPEEEATAGSVTFTSVVDGESIIGTYNLTFPSGKVKGTFSAGACK